jgi:hypothetical protein
VAPMCQRLVHAVVASPVAVQAVQDDSAFGSVQNVAVK